jgi:hypothetical protein
MPLPRDYIDLIKTIYPYGPIGDNKRPAYPDDDAFDIWYVKKDDAECREMTCGNDPVGRAAMLRDRHNSRMVYAKAMHIGRRLRLFAKHYSDRGLALQAELTMTRTKLQAAEAAGTALQTENDRLQAALQAESLAPKQKRQRKSRE